MKLAEVGVETYGPLNESLDFGDGLQVIFGPNESGKTLLVDALLWLLTGENADDRVGQAPHGYVSLDEGERVRRLDADETVLDRFEAVHGVELPAHTFRNSFVVRSADASLRDEDRYYDRATDVVAESLVADVQRLHEAVAERGRITTGTQRKLWDRQTDGYVKTHRNEARDLAEEIESFVDAARADGVPSLEADLFRTERELKRADGRVDTLQAAKRRQQHADACDRHERLQAKLERRESLPADRALAELGREVAETLETEASANAAEARRDRSGAHSRTLVIATAGLGAIGLGLGAWLLASFGLSLLPLTAGGLFLGIVVIAGGLSVYYWREYRQAAGELADLRSHRSDVMSEAAAVDLEAESIRELSAEIGRLREVHKDLTGEINRLNGRLQADLDLTTDTPAETVERGAEELDRRAVEFEKFEPVEFSERKLRAAEEQRAELEQDRAAIESQLEDVREAMRQFRDQVADIPFERYDVEAPSTAVESVAGLEAVAEHLTELVARIEREADNARAAMDVLSALEREERRAVADLFFGAESDVSAHFSTITGGRYEAVSYDEADNALTVQRDTGVTLPPEQLSQSTFDQLYLAVRLAFARRLLDGAAGFLVLDDAFLAADATRLARQAELLTDLEAAGWQIVYFTAKRDAREALTATTGADVIELGPLD